MPPKILKADSDTEYLYDGPFDCWAQSCTHPTITQKTQCPRKDSLGNSVTRIEKNSKVEKLASIDPNKFSFARVTRITSAINGKEDKGGYIDGMANMKTCKLYIEDLVDADGVELCNNINYGAAESNFIPIKEPDCGYPELIKVAGEFSDTLALMSNGKVSTDASLLMPFVGSDSWGSCSFLIDQALQFTDVKKEIVTQGCPYDWDMTEGSDWSNDPCCNWMLSDHMCCAPRNVEVDVPEASVDTDKLADYCAQDVAQLTMAIFASKAFVEAKADSVDPTSGCVGQRQRDMQKYKGLDAAADECAKEVVGEHQADGKRKSTKTCTLNSECASGICQEAEGGGGGGGGGGGAATRYCQTSNLPEHLAACLLTKFESVPKAQAILKDVTTNGNIKANAFQVGQGLASLAGREMCTGPEGWYYDPEWPSCKYGTDEDGNWYDAWDWETGECTEYFCQGKDDCKEKCLNTPAVCNVDPWNTEVTQEECESDKMGGNFCAMCWSGDQDCYEVSQPTICRVDRHGNDWDGQFTQEMCTTLLGVGGVLETESHWGSTETKCTLPSATTETECVNVDNVCEEIGFKDQWGCMTEKNVDDCWSDMPKSLRPEHVGNADDLWCWPENCDPNADDDCWCDGYASWHEQWIEYKKHNWKPICTWEVIFDTEEEARAGCPEVAGMEVMKLRSKEELCKTEQFCFSKDLDREACYSIDTSSLLSDFNTNGGSAYWNPHTWYDEDLEVCKVQFETWGGMTNLAAAAKTCGDMTGFTWKTGKYFEEGRFDTVEKCTAGVCDQDPGGWMGLTAEECVETASCSNWNCLGCEKDWSMWDAPYSICWIPTAADGSAMTEELCTHSNYTGTWKDIDLKDGSGQTQACIIEGSDGNGPESCKHTYAECNGMRTEQCGGGDGWNGVAGAFDNVITEHFLGCQASAWSECKTKAECEAVGDCWGGMRRHYCYMDECSIWNNVCVAPKIKDEWGWESCDSYGGWEDGVEWTETGCIILSIDNEADCISEKKGTWTSTEETEETCLATKKCREGEGWFNNMDTTECDKCDKEWMSTNTWWGNSWNVGKMRSMYKWKQRKYESKTDWVSELDTWRVKEVMKEIVNALNEEVEGTFVKCMYSPLIDSMKKIACVCGKDRESCDLEGTFGGGVSLVETTAYTGAAETAGKQSGTRLEIGSESVNTTASVEISSKVFIPPVSEDTGSVDYGSSDATGQQARRALKRMYRKLTGAEDSDSENSLNSAGCATVVKNSAGFYVGQMVGDCVTLTISEALVEPSKMCIGTKANIERAPEYSIAGVGIVNPNEATDVLSEDDYIIIDVGVVTETNGQFCFFVSDSITVCPIMHAPNPESAAEDVTEGKCGLVEQIVTEVVLKKECEMGDRKSCAWLEPGSMSAAAAMATGVLVLLIIGGCCCSTLIGGIVHPKSRAVMMKHLNKAFYDEIDKDGDGLLDKSEIRAMLDKEFGEKISDEDLNKLFDQFDLDHNGQLDFNEYKKMMNAHKINGGPSRSQNQKKVHPL
jgi:hypothetical protein